MATELFIKGYQWSPVTKKFIGDYDFPNNQDKEDIHLPPNTTLTAPPSVTSGFCAFWIDGSWVVDTDPDLPQKPTLPPYDLITNEFIEYLQENGWWSEEDQQKRDAALATIEAERLAQEAEQAEQQALLQAQLASVLNVTPTEGDEGG